MKQNSKYVFAIARIEVVTFIIFNMDKLLTVSRLAFYGLLMLNYKQLKLHKLKFQGNSYVYLVKIRCRF